MITCMDAGPGVAAGRACAAELAARAGVPLTLYDRSEETWADSQHPEGPLPPDDPRLEDRPHLVDQIRELDPFDVSVQAWVSTLPTISAVTTAVAELGADTIVVPAALERKLFERALVGDSLAEAIRVQISRQPQLDVTVVEVAEDGTVADS